MSVKKEISLPIWSSVMILEIIIMMVQAIIFGSLIYIIPWCWCIVQPLPIPAVLQIIVTDCLAISIFLIFAISSRKGVFPQKSLYGLLRLLNIIFSVVLTICFFIDIQGFELHLSGYLLVYSLPFSFVIPLISLILLLKS
ncbi:MAG: hypothetical protein ACTSVO_00095 [Candidatus Heimdallarchaeaceae archaeon]